MSNAIHPCSFYAQVEMLTHLEAFAYVQRRSQARLLKAMRGIVYGITSSIKGKYKAGHEIPSFTLGEDGIRIYYFVAPEAVIDRLCIM